MFEYAFKHPAGGLLDDAPIETIGCAIVGFEEDLAAINCSKSLNSSHFNDFTLRTTLFSNAVEFYNTTASHESKDGKVNDSLSNQVEIPMSLNSLSVPQDDQSTVDIVNPVSKEGNIDHEAIQKEVESVEDFLNSLL